MADYEKAYLDIIVKHEGGYVNDPDDTGGETYRGISRKYHPDIPMWARIDVIKETRRINDNDVISELEEEVKSFYRENYWGGIKGLWINYQELAVKLFDMSIHLGLSRTVRLLQEGLNIFNLFGILWQYIEEDGIFGEQTLDALTIADVKNRAIVLTKYLKCEQGHLYKKSIHDRTKNQKYAYSWYSRI
jgi:lysozyme family protein